MSNILITGASSGFGLLTVQKTIKAGHTPIAAMRDSEGRNRETAESIRGLGGHVVDIDVTNEASVALGVAAAIEISGSIDVLVNNAGTGVLGIQDAFTVDDIQRVFDVNVYGVHRMQRAITPHFIQRQAGLIINISSTLGRITFPFFGPYNASKWAMEALSENSRAELSAFGIEVAIIEPGGYPTQFLDRVDHPSDQERLKIYGDLVGAPAATQQGFEQAFAANPEQAPENVAQAILAVIDTPAGRRPFRTVVDKLGMAEPISEYNEKLGQITEGIYAAFGVAHMLKVNA